MTIRCAADIRMQLMGGRTFVMQVAHPAVGTLPPRHRDKLTAHLAEHARAL